MSELRTSDAKLTAQEIVEHLDPDWRDHFRDIDHAAEHYQRYALGEWLGAVRELRS
jgi:hypothetical protein